jgi:hypothetical protein
MSATTDSAEVKSSLATPVRDSGASAAAGDAKGASDKAGESDSSVVAIDVLLLPDEKARERSIAASAALSEGSKDVSAARRFKLDDSHLPHVTPAQAFVQRSSLPELFKQLKEALSKSEHRAHTFNVTKIDRETSAFLRGLLMLRPRV